MDLRRCKAWILVLHFQGLFLLGSSKATHHHITSPESMETKRLPNPPTFNVSDIENLLLTRFLNSFAFIIAIDVQ